MHDPKKLPERTPGIENGTTELKSCGRFLESSSNRPFHGFFNFRHGPVRENLLEIMRPQKGKDSLLFAWQNHS